MAFVKGQSGNPSGRPKENEEVKALAREYTEEAIERLAFWMRGENPKASVSAAQTLLDRGYGKAPQAIGGTDDLPPISMKEIVIRSIDAARDRSAEESP